MDTTALVGAQTEARQTSQKPETAYDEGQSTNEELETLPLGKHHGGVVMFMEVTGE